MKQANQIGKKTKKEQLFQAYAGRTFVTPCNKSYVFNYDKLGNKYTIVIGYMGQNWRISESDFNRNDIDVLLNGIEQSLHIS